MQNVELEVTSNAEFKQIFYIDDTWFTSVDSSAVSYEVDVDDILGSGDELGIVSGNDQFVIQSELLNDVNYNLTSNNIKTSSRLIKDD